jgi:hypothetical protein
MGPAFANMSILISLARSDAHKGLFEMNRAPLGRKHRRHDTSLPRLDGVSLAAPIACATNPLTHVKSARENVVELLAVACS